MLQFSGKGLLELLRCVLELVKLRIVVAHRDKASACELLDHFLQVFLRETKDCNALKKPFLPALLVFDRLSILTLLLFGGMRDCLRSPFECSLDLIVQFDQLL